MGAATIPATAAITEGLPRSQQGVGSALNDLSREVGGALGIAVVGSILAATYRSHLQLGAAVPPPLADKARGSFAVAIHVGGPVQVAAQSAFVDGLRYALLAVAGVAFVGAAIVSILLRRRRPRSVGNHGIASVAQATAVQLPLGLAAATPSDAASNGSLVGDMKDEVRVDASCVGTCPTCGGQTSYHEAHAPSPSYYWCEHCQAGWSRANPCAESVPSSAGRIASLAGACR
jgi:hypothetical protein